MNKLLIIGTGEFAQIAYEYFTYDSTFDVVGFAVEENFLKEKCLNGLEVSAYHLIEDKYDKDEIHIFVAIPSSNLNKLRSRFYQDLKNKGYRFATYISSKAFVWRNAQIGENCFIFENNVIQPFVTIEDNCILWSGNHVGHRTIIRKNSFITSHVVVSGYCEIGENSFIGVNSTINDRVIIPPFCVVGSASCVVKSLPKSESLYIGSPCRLIEGKNVFDLDL